MVALEIVAQIDILMDFGTKNSKTPILLDLITKKFVPAVSSLSVHVDGDVRVVVSASLRRMIPTILKDLDEEDVENCLNTFLEYIPILMNDHAPIPQYTLRLLCESIRISQYATQYIISKLILGGGLNIFITLLGGIKNIKNNKNNKNGKDKDKDKDKDRDQNGKDKDKDKDKDRDQNGKDKDKDKDKDRDQNGKDKDKDRIEGFVEEETSTECDPQLPILLRILYEKGQIEEQEQAVVQQQKNHFSGNSPVIINKKDCTKITYIMLEMGISQSLCFAIHLCMNSSNSSTGPESAHPSDELVVPVQTELLCSLIELLHR